MSRRKQRKPSPMPPEGARIPTSLKSHRTRDVAQILTHKQLKFIAEYMVDTNAKQAAIRAGYSPKSANVTGTELLKRPAVISAIQRRQADIAAAMDITPERVLREWAIIAFADQADYIQVQDDGSAVVDLSQCDRERLRAISEIQVDEYKDGNKRDAREVKRVKIRCHSKTQALEALSKHLGLFEADNKQRGLEAFASFISGRIGDNATERKQVDSREVVSLPPVVPIEAETEQQP